MTNSISISRLLSDGVEAFSFCRKEAIGKKEQVGTSDLLLAIVNKAGDNCRTTGSPHRNKELQLLIKLGLKEPKQLYFQIKKNVREQIEKGLPRLDGANMSCSANFSYVVLRSAKISKMMGYEKLNSGVLLLAILKLQRGIAYAELKKINLDPLEVKKATLKIWKPKK